MKIIQSIKMKIDKIVKLEAKLGFELNQINSVAELKMIGNNRSFLVDDDSRIIGLKLYNCGLANLHDLREFTDLRYLYLNKNQISDVGALSNHPRINELDLAFNLITDISGLSTLYEMTSLDLRFNKIEDISSLTYLLQITDLDLRENLISDISPLVGLLKRGMTITNTGFGYKSINIMSNKIDPVVLSIIEKGNNAILRHFERIEEEGFDYIYEAKLTLVGDGSSGKTSFQVRLLDEMAVLPTSEGRTRGIQIHDWVYKLKNGKNCIAHVWDFGGQDVYYPVHRFFITENSVFVLFASTRNVNHNFDYWIPTIFQFSGESPIIIVQTCFDGIKKKWTDINHYFSSGNFNIIKTQTTPYYEINLPGFNFGLDDVKESIVTQISKLKHFGKKVPRSWVKIRSAVLEKSKEFACITFEEFTKLARISSENNQLKLIDIEDNADFFHSLGILIWYRHIEELKNWVILKPEWAMNAVYRIIDDAEVQSKMGIISKEDFYRIWDEETYRHKHDVLKKMLEVFKIAFPRKNKSAELLMPSRLESISTDEIWKKDRSMLAIEYHFSFMPKGLINQICADLSNMIFSDASIWNDAVIFQDNEKMATAQLVEKFYEKKIGLLAKGKEARALIKIVMNSINGVVEEYRGVKPDIMIPCICEVCRNCEKPVLFEYQKLLSWLITRDVVRCNESASDVSIRELLFEAGLSQEVSTDFFVPLKTFISYSKFDGEACVEKDGINYLEQFKEAIVPLTKHNALIETWDDTKIIASEDWNFKIIDEIKSADIIFLLISSSFLNTDYIIKNEFEFIWTRHKEGDCLVIPIIIKQCGWQDVNWIAEIAATPKKGKSISSWKDYSSSIDAAWTEVYTDVKTAVQNYIKLKNPKMSRPF